MIARLILQSLAWLASMGVLLFGAAGTLGWVELVVRIDLAFELVEESLCRGRGDFVARVLRGTSEGGDLGAENPVGRVHECPLVSVPSGKTKVMCAAVERQKARRRVASNRVKQGSTCGLARNCCRCLVGRLH